VFEKKKSNGMDLCEPCFKTIFRLVENINKSIGQDVDSKVQIGVLDIYGFESFKNNRYTASLSFISFHFIYSNALMFCSSVPINSFVQTPNEVCH